MKKQIVSLCVCFPMILSTVLFTACSKSMTSSVASTSDTIHTITAEQKDVIYPDTFGFGQSISEAYIQKFDIDVRPDGKGLPVGTGIIKEGRTVFQQKCVLCHGATGREGGIGGKLVSSPLDSNKTKTIGNYWPYATTIYDYVYRAMPFNEPGSLTSKEVYDLTAYLLYENGIIDSTFLITEKTLPLIEMPAKKLFVPDDRGK